MHKLTARAIFAVFGGANFLKPLLLLLVLSLVLAACSTSPTPTPLPPTPTRAVPTATSAPTPAPTATPAPPTPTKGPDLVYRSFVDAINRGDVTGSVTFFTDDAVFVVRPACPPENPCVGKAAIQRRNEIAVSELHARWDIVNLQVSGDTLTIRVEERNDVTRAAGVDRTIFLETATIRGDKIARRELRSDLSDPQTATFSNFQRLSRILRQHYDAVNSGDLASAVRVFTNDAEVIRSICSPQAPCKGAAEIQRLLQFEVTAQSRYSFLSVTVSGNNVTARLEQRNVNIQSAGVGRVIFNVSSTFVGENISRLVHELDAADPESQTFANFQRVSNIGIARNTALARGNLTGVMALFADDAVMEGFGLCVPARCSGKQAIQKEIERQIADKTNITPIPGSARVSGDTATFRQEVRSDSIRAAGAERVIAVENFEVKGSRVTLVRWALDQTDPQTATYLKSQGK